MSLRPKSKDKEFRDESRSIRADGIGAKAILMADERRELARQRRWGYRAVQHDPRCARLLAGFTPTSVCNCDELPERPVERTVEIRY